RAVIYFFTNKVLSARESPRKSRINLQVCAPHVLRKTNGKQRSRPLVQAPRTNCAAPATVNMLCMPARYQPCSTLGSFTGGTVGIPLYRLLHLRMLLRLATCGDARYSGLTMSSTYYRQSIAVLSSL